MQKILDKLEKVKRVRGGGFKARCPSHPDSTASLFINQDEHRILLKCFAGCSAQDIVRDLGLQMSDLFSDDKGEEMEGLATVLVKDKGKKYKSIEDICKNFKTLEAKYEYNRDGEEPSILQIRYTIEGSKSFATFHKEEDGWYSGKGEKGLTPLYNLDAVKEAKSVLIVEGEKVVDLLKDYGIVATTSLGGAQNASGSDFSSLIGKRVAFWRDADEPGLKYESDVQSILNKLGIGLRCVDVNKLNLEKGADLEEFIDLHSSKSKKEITKLIYSLIPQEKKDDIITSVTDSHLKPYLDKVYAGEADNLEMIGFPILSDITQMMVPGSISLIYSQPGVGKSLLTQQLANMWTELGEIRVKSLLLESSINTYLLRCLSRVSRRFDVLKNKFHKENPIESARIVNEYSDILDLCGSTMVTSDLQKGRRVVDWTPETVIEFIKQNAPIHDVIIIDPISRVLGMGRGLIWEDTNKITAQTEAILSDNPHCRVIFVHHPTDLEGGSVSGGMGWSRFVHNTLYIVKEPEEVLYEIITNDGDIITTAIDRYILIKKCRFGEGLDTKIAIKMAKDCLSFEEVGRIIRKFKS